MPPATSELAGLVVAECLRQPLRLGTAAGSWEEAQLLRKAGLYLGLLSLDGEAAAIDVAASVRWLRLAACAGMSVA